MRLIDADNLKEQVKAIHKAVDATSVNTDFDIGFHSATSQIMGLIEFFPTVEAKPVVHGKWIYNEYYTWECGNCGFHPFKGYIPKEPGFNYCPNCGCDMTKEV